jgi:phosphinothricin acetyltransferase
MGSQRRMDLNVRPASEDDCEAIASIYNEGIDDRIATFETRHRTATEIAAWLDTRYPVVVVVKSDRIIAFAAASTYRPRDCYDGIAEFSVYVANGERGRGAGQLAMEALIEAAESAGFWKLLSRVFTENSASLSLLRSLGFREVGTYEKHGKLDGEWRDVVIVERLLGSFADD